MNSGDRPRLLFTSTFLRSFIDADISILSRHYDLYRLSTTGPGTIIAYWKALRNADLTFSWFLSLYSSLLVFLARLRHKKSYIVLGGGDTAANKELAYGIWNAGWKRPFLRYGATHATALLCVDGSLKESLMRQSGCDGRNVFVIPTGYDPEEWKPGGTKDKMVLTVAACASQQRLLLKGIDRFLHAAKSLPSVQFVAAGIAPELLPTLDVPPNALLLPPLGKRELLGYYRRAKVFCQLSRIDALPNTLCEAMLCGCIPVGTTVGGIPAAIGTTGYVVDGEKIDNICSAITEALACEPAHGQTARDHIVQQYSLERREQALVALMKQIGSAS
ncbi:MAG: glycosyltransferase family 4 protein [Ignavibacteriales bacterium]|nr:glycosyltransferase family 4 protein [Ignavibacteriales bacterium]